MSNHHQDRKLVKEPKSIRFDSYQEQFIAAAANWQGSRFSEMVRELCEEAIDARLNAMRSSKQSRHEAHDTDMDVI